MQPKHLWGIDVSKWQGDIDWPAVKAAGVQFAFAKATDGIGYTDPLFRRNAGGANAVGVPVGFYHYAHPENNTAVAEAEAFVEAVNGLPVDLPYVLDLEGDKAAAIDRDIMTTWAVTWLQEVKKRTGKRVMLYTGAYFARDNVGPALGAFPLWIAQYGAVTPLENSNWEKWSVFQYSEGGSCPGIVGAVDMNLMEADFMDEVTGKNTVAGFSDVPADHWAAKAIEAVKAAGIMTGYQDGTFKPDNQITRAEVAAIVNDLLYLINNK